MLASISRLFSGAFDYAGLYPPASLGFEDASARFAHYRHGRHSWALGRFVVPAARLSELPTEARAADATWPLAVLLGTDASADVARARAFVQEHPTASLAALEVRADSVGALSAVVDALPPSVRLDLPVYVEVPLSVEAAPLLDRLADAGLGAKARTGGITPDAIPSVEAVFRFLSGCFRRALPFKLTAGLHHAIRSASALTYEPASPRAVMHGFLNVFVAAALLAAGAPEPARAALHETDGRAFRFDADGLAWRAHRADLARLTLARRLMGSCGTCSFDEPMADLAALGWIPS